MIFRFSGERRTLYGESKTLLVNQTTSSFLRVRSDQQNGSLDPSERHSLPVILSVIQHAILVREFIILCAYTLDRCANVCSARKLVFRCLICYGTANDGYSKDRVTLFCI